MSLFRGEASRNTGAAATYFFLNAYILYRALSWPIPGQLLLIIEEATTSKQKQYDVKFID